ncbi:MAG: glycoside hydrolase family 127 protein [Promethearchaeota archaeon]
MAWRRARFRPVPPRFVRVDDAFWNRWRRLALEKSLPSQLANYRLNHTLANFEVAAERVKARVAGVGDGREGRGELHEGWFFQDSDLYKWVEAVCAFVEAGDDIPCGLMSEMERVVDSIVSAQEPDGYLNTYYSTCFPERRWSNLYFTHELYCAGHFIEAAVVHHSATGSTKLLNAAKKFAERICEDFGVFSDCSPRRGIDYPGHPEVELALVRLSRALGKDDPVGPAALAAAEWFVRGRGRRGSAFSVISAALKFLREQRLVNRRGGRRDHGTPQVPEASSDVGQALRGMRPKLFFRVLYSYLTRRWAQAHAPVAKQRGPVGHAVRAAYLYAAVADLVAEGVANDLAGPLADAWDRMATARCYVTGGLGALPVVEGFGRDHELPNESSYAETCAAIGNVLWSWRCFLAFGEAKYAEMVERALYNAVLGGLGADGVTYFYENALESRTGVARRAWFPVSCCPSNVARLLGGLGGFVASWSPADPETGEPAYACVHLPLGCRVSLPAGEGAPALDLSVSSEIPWGGRVVVVVEAGGGPIRARVGVRVPGWTENPAAAVDGEPLAPGPRPLDLFFVEREWTGGERLELDFPAPVRFVHASPSVADDRGKVTIFRGPLAYCLEGVDNPGLDVFDGHMAGGDATSPATRWVDELGGFCSVGVPWRLGQPDAPRSGGPGWAWLVPYALRANRGRSPFRVWLPHAGVSSAGDVFLL